MDKQFIALERSGWAYVQLCNFLYRDIQDSVESKDGHTEKSTNNISRASSLKKQLSNILHAYVILRIINVYFQESFCNIHDHVESSILYFRNSIDDELFLMKKILERLLNTVPTSKEQIAINHEFMYCESLIEYNKNVAKEMKYFTAIEIYNGEYKDTWIDCNEYDLVYNKIKAYLAMDVEFPKAQTQKYATVCVIDIIETLKDLPSIRNAKAKGREIAHIHDVSNDNILRFEHRLDEYGRNNLNKKLSRIKSINSNSVGDTLNKIINMYDYALWAVINFGVVVDEQFTDELNSLIVQYANMVCFSRPINEQFLNVHNLNHFKYEIQNEVSESRLLELSKSYMGLGPRLWRCHDIISVSYMFKDLLINVRKSDKYEDSRFSSVINDELERALKSLIDESLSKFNTDLLAEAKLDIGTPLNNYIEHTISKIYDSKISDWLERTACKAYKNKLIHGNIKCNFIQEKAKLSKSNIVIYGSSLYRAVGFIRQSTHNTNIPSIIYKHSMELIEYMLEMTREIKVIHMDSDMNKITKNNLCIIDSIINLSIGDVESIYSIINSKFIT